MPRYFFNLQLGPAAKPDAEGTVLPNSAAAISAAKNLLPSLASEMVWGEFCDLAVDVRDEAGHGVFSASLRLEASYPVAAHLREVDRTPFA